MSKIYFHVGRWLLYHVKVNPRLGRHRREEEEV
jgi:hypothetical protein